MIELLQNRSILRISGIDSLKFLQNIVTNDITRNKNTYNYLLSPQGRYLYDFFISKIADDELLIDIHSSFAQSFINKINLYKLRSIINIEDLTANYCVLYSKKELENNADIIISYQDPRFHKLGIRSIINSSNINSFNNMAKDLYIEDKYEYAIPDGVNDLLFDRSIIVNFGAEELSAISFTKGCYIGQEVISRSKYQGVVRKKIFKIKSNTEIANIDIGTEINNINGDKIGIFCSAHVNRGIALLHEEQYLELKHKMAFINKMQEIEITIPAWRN